MFSLKLSTVDMPIDRLFLENCRKVFSVSQHFSDFGSLLTVQEECQQLIHCVSAELSTGTLDFRQAQWTVDSPSDHFSLF